MCVFFAHHILIFIFFLYYINKGMDFFKSIITYELDSNVHSNIIRDILQLLKNDKTFNEFQIENITKYIT